MEAFTHMGNHLISDSGPTINAGDDMTDLDPDESILNMAGGPQRRRHDDEDDGSDGFDDDDLESMASTQVDGLDKKHASKPEEELELPPHACS